MRKLVWGLALLFALMPCSGFAEDPLGGRFVKHEVRVEPVGTPDCGSPTESVSTDPSVNVPVNVACYGRSFSAELELTMPETMPMALPSGDGAWFDLQSPLSVTLHSELTTTAPGDTEREPYSVTLYSQVVEGASVICSDSAVDLHNAYTTKSKSLDLPCAVSHLVRWSPTSAQSAFASVAVFAVGNNQGPSIQMAVTVRTIIEYGQSVPLSITPSVAPNTIVPELFDEPLSVLIRGGGFDQNATVSLGDIFVQNVRVVDETTIEAELAGFTGLPEGPRDLVVTNPGGEPMRGDDLFFVSSLVPKAPEINQGIPIYCGTGGRTCIANHDTLVRVPLECSGSGCTNGKDQARGWLHVFRDGSPLPGSPFAASPESVATRAVGATLDAPTLQTLGDSLNFAFAGADSLSEGTYDFIFEIDPRDPSVLPARSSQPNANDHLVWRREEQTFRASSTSQRIRAVVLFDVTASRLRSRYLPMATTYFDFLRAAYPASRDLLEFDLIPDSWITWESYNATMTALANWLNTQRKLLTEPYTHVILATAAAVPDLGLTYCGTKGSDYYCLANAIVVRADGDSVESTIAHEVGHTFLLGETYLNPVDQGRGEEARSSLNLPDSSCLFLEDGCPVEDGHVDLLLRETSVNLQTTDPNYRTFVKRDLMGRTGREQRWMDFRTWSYFYGIFNEGNPIGTSSRRPLASGNWISVAGTVGASGGGTLGRFWHGTGTFTETSVPTGDWSIEIQNAARVPLTTKSFHIDFLPIHQRTQPLTEAPFNITMSLPAAAEWVALMKNGVELDSRRIVSSPPTVRVIFPNGGENLSGTTTIRWEGSDVDGDPLSYAVLYEPEAGRQIPIATGIETTSLEWDTGLAPSTSAGRITVVANDGFNDASDRSDGTFRVADGGPAVSILEPDDMAVVELGVPLTFRGAAWDADDGTIAPEHLTFRSSRDGLLGTGTSVTATLTAGLHTITLSAEDGDGHIATDTISVTVYTSADILRILPSAGSLQGSLGSLFRTGVQIHNPTDGTVAGRFVYHPAGYSGSSGDPSLGFSLAPGQTVYYPDLLPAMSQSGLGSVDLVTSLGSPPLSVVRIFNDGGANGTSGMTEPQFDPNDVLKAGDKAVLILPPDPNRLRFNIGIRTLDSGGSFYPTLLSKDGVLKYGLGKKSYPPNYFVQFAASDWFQGRNVTFEGTDIIQISVADGSLIIYGASTDNTTQDPSLQFPTAQASIGPTGERRIIPVVGSLEGSLGSYFKTELQFHNAQTRKIRVRIDYRDMGYSTIRGSLEFDLINHRSYYIPDLLPAMGIASGLGSADITAISSVGGLPASVVRIFNDAGANGTSGMTEEAVAPADALKPGQSGVLVAPPDPERARFNIGVRALDAGCSMSIAVRDKNGNLRTTLAKAYGPNVFLQIDSPTMLGLTLAASDTITFTINSGSAIVYGATVDNITQDPSLQYAKISG